MMSLRGFYEQFLIVGLIQLSMSDSSDFEEGDFEVLPGEAPTEPLSVRKYIPEAKNLMDKILFTSYKINPMFPTSFTPIPDVLKPETAQKDSNNMNLIEQSAFRHEKLKKDVLGFLLNSNIPKAPSQKNIPSISSYYDQKQPIYEKYPVSSKSKSMATYLLDSKTILKQDLQQGAKLVGEPRSAQVTYRGRIQFNSSFQSGNLFRVYQKEYNEFDLLLQNDINTRGNNQWFFFSVKNAPKNVSIKFNIVNLSKKHSLFDLGMKPYAFSLCRYQKRKVGWVREGTRINYEENKLFRRENSDKPYHVLSFQYKFPHEGDVVYFCHSIPYGVSELSAYLGRHVQEKANSRLMRFKSLARTLGNQEIDIIQISDEASRENKEVVWLIGRQHSGQVTSSFMMEGLINMLLSKSSQASFLLRMFVFKIVPMVNMDGVIHGNSRAELSGADPNRKWAKPHKMRNPVVWELKKAIEKDGEDVAMVLDLHSHSRKLGTFFYGNSPRDSKTSTRKFPMMVCLKDPRFAYTSCRFSPCNPNSARHVLFESLQTPLIYTVESSFYGYQKDDYKIVEYLPQDYREMGQVILETFCEYQKVRLAKEAKIWVAETEQELELENKRLKQVSIQGDDGSDSDPSGDEYEDKQLKGILPNLFGAKKTKEKKVVKKKKTHKETKKQLKDVTVIQKPVKNDKESHYRIYFSGKSPLINKRVIQRDHKPKIETVEFGVQATFAESRILRGATNTTDTGMALVEKRSSLCIWGQKVEEQVSALGGNVGVQVDLSKYFAQHRQEVRMQSRKSFKLSSRASSILQVKENNFLNRGDCHTVPLRSLGRK